MTRNRRGFTLIELLMVLTIIGIIASFAVPKLQDMKRRATATQILGDFDVVRHAAMSFYVDSGYFPAEAGRAAVPRNLRPYLPNGFSMAKPQWTIDYENWSMRKGSKFVKTGIAIGVSFNTSDPRLGQTAMRLAGNTPSFTMGSKYTLLVSGF